MSYGKDIIKSFAEQETVKFADFILDDYEMTTDDEDNLCWVLAGTNQKRSSKELYKISKELEKPAKLTKTIKK